MPKSNRFSYLRPEKKEETLSATQRQIVQIQERYGHIILEILTELRDVAFSGKTVKFQVVPGGKTLWHELYLDPEYGIHHWRAIIENEAPSASWYIQGRDVSIYIDLLKKNINDFEFHIAKSAPVGSMVENINVKSLKDVRTAEKKFTNILKKMFPPEN